MGICSSCEATAVVVPPTAKVILPDGRLQEYDRPVKSSHVLQQKDQFVCDADEMEFNGFVSAMDANEHLRMGQLYFLLPRSMLRRPLHAEEVAALAVKASAALVKANGCRSRHVGSCLAVDFPMSQRRAERDNVGVITTNDGKKHRRRSRSGGSGRSFSCSLGSIVEERTIEIDYAS